MVKRGYSAFFASGWMGGDLNCKENNPWGRIVDVGLGCQDQEAFFG